MAKRKRQILVIADFPLYKDKVHGGLQRRIFPVLVSLSNQYEIHLFCGEGSDIQLKNAKIYQAYNPRCVMLKEFITPFKKLSEQADMLLSLETMSTFPKPVKRILIMGGMAYDWSWEIVKGSNWSCIVVPSEHAQHLLARKGIQSKVIHNGYNWVPFLRASLERPYARTTNRKKILISPHRPDLAKGHHEAVLLTSKLIKLGVDCTLRIPRQDFFMTPEKFYENLSKFAQKHIGSKNFILDPWVKADSMPEYYAAADLTLVLGSTQEGFGAVVVESIVSGTPVLATRRGAIPNLVPEENGLFLIDINQQATKKVINLVMSIVTGQQPRLDEFMKRGQQFICSHYDNDNMTMSYIDLAKKMLSPRRI